VAPAQAVVFEAAAADMDAVVLTTAALLICVKD
jgi:hypothetical protein